MIQLTLTGDEIRNMCVNSGRLVVNIIGDDAEALAEYLGETLPQDITVEHHTIDDKEIETEIEIEV